MADHPTPPKDVYLGDGVYAHVDGFRFMLYTNYGDGPENEIFIDPDVLQDLIKFVNSLLPEHEYKLVKKGGVDG